MSDWIYQDKPFELNEMTPKEIYGFVYLIENLENGKKYIGKKFFWAKKTLPANKTRKRKKRLIVESDWKDYYGSSELLQKDVELYGKDKFRRTILHLCKTKGECAFLEAQEQFDRNVLLLDEYYNNWISVRVRSAHIKGLHL